MICKKCRVDKEKTTNGKCICPEFTTSILCSCGRYVDVANLHDHYLYDHFNLIW